MFRSLLSRLFGDESENLAGDAAAYWRQSDHDPSRRDESHWRGEGRYAEDTQWRAIGQRTLDRILQLQRLTQRDNPMTRVLEWGPGGGSNAVAFAEHAKTAEFIGVDISKANLDECSRQLQPFADTSFHPVLIEPDDPESVRQSVASPIDVFVSTAVYQHFPGTEYGRRVTAIASSLLAEGGLALIQIRYDDGTRFYRSRRRDYERYAMRFTSYRVGEFWKLAEGCGLTNWGILLNPKVNYATYLLSKEPCGETLAS